MLTISLLSIGLMTGCKKEAKLTPSDKPEDIYSDSSLPQGNHPYDADILQLFKNYRTFFLYKYQPRDLYYNVLYNSGGVYDSASNTVTKGGYFDVPADQQYVGDQLNMLKQLWLNYYPDSLLRKGLPQKVYLLDSMYFSLPGQGTPGDLIYWYYYDVVYPGGDYIAVTWGAARIKSMTPDDKYYFKSRINDVFLTKAHAAGAITTSKVFAAVSDYSSVDYYNYNAMGLVDYYSKTPDLDWDAFVRIIVSNSYATLTSPGNILDPSVDTQGLIMKKYHIVLAYFMSTFGVDLQAIGNAGI